MNSPNLFHTWLASDRPILFDGAMGTMLHAEGVHLDACFDELNLSRPDLIESIHSAYIKAGAQVIETNTFGGNRYKLAPHGLSDRLAEINHAAVEIAHRAVEIHARDVLVAGSVGPLGVHIAPLGRVSQAAAVAAYREQMEALQQAGVDLLIIETQHDLQETRLAIQAARSFTDLPLIASMTFTRDNRTLLGDTPTSVAKSLSESGANVIGANCSEGPAQLLRILEEMKEAAPEMEFALLPNAGWPARVSDRIIYPANKNYFAEYAHIFAEAGVKVIGGCCGTTPEHTAAMRLAIEEPPRRKRPTISVVTPREPITPLYANGAPTELAAKLDEGSFVVTAEMHPPKGLSTHKLLAQAQLLRDAGADVVNVADSPMARMRMSPWAACQLIQSTLGIETVLHFPTRGRNLLRVQGDLLAAHVLGVRNIFVVMGDPTAIGDYPEAMDNFDVVPSGLIQLINTGFNQGRDHAGGAIDEATSFFTGCALNLTAQNPERELRVLHRKIGAGASFALTQPIFEASVLDSFVQSFGDRYGPLDIPILAGLLPLENARHANFLQNEVPGMVIPESTIQRIEAAGDRSREEGKEIALDLIDSLKMHAQGLYIIPSFGHYDTVAEIIEAAKA